MKRILSVFAAWVLMSSAYAAVLTPQAISRQDVMRIAMSAKADTVNVIGNDIDEKEYFKRENVWDVAFYNTERTMLVRMEYQSTSFTGTFTTPDFTCRLDCRYDCRDQGLHGYSCYWQDGRRRYLQYAHASQLLHAQVGSQSDVLRCCLRSAE